MLVMMLRAAEFLCPRDLSCEFLRSVDQDRKALGANPDLFARELQYEERNLQFRLLTLEAAFRFS